MHQDPKSSSLDKPVYYIHPPKFGLYLNLREIWEYRELLFFFIWRDLLVRYKQTAIGVTWIIIQPIFSMGIFSFIFGTIAQLPSQGIPYPLFIFCALVPWQLFARALGSSSISLVNQSPLITKTYFPRLIIPLASVLSGMVDFFVSLIVLFCLLLFYGIVPSLRIFTLPLFFILALVTATAIGLWFSALNVKFRDIHHILPFLTQFWMFITPVAYGTSIIPAYLLPVYALNPMVCVVEGFRWSLLGPTYKLPGYYLISLITTVVMFFGGLIYFRNTEDFFADII